MSLFVKRFRKDSCTMRASALSFTTLLSLVPLFTVSFSLLSALPAFETYAAKIQGFIIQNFVATSAEVIQSHLQNFVRQASKASGIGMILLLATAVLMVFNMEQAFNAIWRAEKHRSFISAFLMYGAVLILAPVLIGIGFFVSTYIISLPYISTAAELLGLKKHLLLITPYISTLAAFTILYSAIPNRKTYFRYALIGGSVATIMFELAKLGFVLYITHFSVYRLLYGALATVPIFLVWIYVCWFVILFGAVVSAVLQERYHKHA